MWTCVQTSWPFLGVAGGALSRSCIYLGPFEIIELTHLSDGERRNAKRSLGEVPAAPTPNLSCLQIAQSLHHNRWDSCLSFLPRSHTFTDVPRTEEQTHTHKLISLFPAHEGAVTPVTCHRWDNQTGGDVCATHLETHKHTHLAPSLCHGLPYVHLLSVHSFFPGLISMSKVSISCLPGASLPQTQSTTKEQMQER